MHRRAWRRTCCSLCCRQVPLRPRSFLWQPECSLRGLARLTQPCRMNGATPSQCAHFFKIQKRLPAACAPYVFLAKAKRGRRSSTWRPCWRSRAPPASRHRQSWPPCALPARPRPPPQPAQPPPSCARRPPAAGAKALRTACATLARCWSATLAADWRTATSSWRAPRSPRSAPNPTRLSPAAVPAARRGPEGARRRT